MTERGTEGQNVAKTDRRLTELDRMIRSYPIFRLEIDELLDDSRPGERFFALLGGWPQGRYASSTGILYGFRATPTQEILKKVLDFCQELNQKEEQWQYEYWPLVIVGLDTTKACLSIEEIFQALARSK